MSFISLDALTALSDEDARRLCGGKAMNLAKLKQAGFRVPNAYVIPTTEFEREVGVALGFADKIGDSRQIVLDMNFSDEFSSTLAACCGAIGTNEFAIRSSATDEDSREHSFAGLLESVIGVTQDRCLDAIRKVWSSFYARERLMFPTQAALDAPVPSMAVLLQECIPSDFAGVVFTRHPLVKDALLVNVARGEGETVVSGKGGESITVLKQEMASATSETLTPSQLQEILRVALEVEKQLGEPQDIEFAFSDGELYLLQTRAIAANASCNEPENHMFSNVNVGEALAGVCTPMTWSVGMSIARHGFDTIFLAAGLTVPASYSFVTTFFGHIYLDISEVLSVAGQVPFITRERFGKIAGIAHISDYIFDYEHLNRSKFIFQMPLSFFRILKTQGRVKHFPEHSVRFCEWRDRFFALDLKTADLSPIFDELYERFIDCGDDLLACAMSFMLAYFLVSSWIERTNPKDAAEIQTKLFSGILDVKSAAPGFELQEMAREIAKDTELKQAFLEGDFCRKYETYFEAFRTSENGRAFLDRFYTFLKNYGLRANQEAELANPRWKDDPSFLLQVIQGHLRAGNWQSATVSAQNQIEDAMAKMFAPNRAVFKKVLAYARNAARTREVWRSYVVDVLGAFRHFFLACAERLVAEQKLAEQNDVFFLTMEEIKAWIKDPSSLADARLRVAFRRARHEAFLSAQTLPATFTRHPNACKNVSSRGKQLHGIPASPGCVRAKVRVIRDLQRDAANLEHGEIIVATSTDVGWTPLFLLASAILTEQGGPLSHAVVVAREYGIPAVVSIPDLLDTLKTGDTVIVQAANGTVTLVE